MLATIHAPAMSEVALTSELKPSKALSCRAMASEVHQSFKRPELESAVNHCVAQPDYVCFGGLHWAWYPSDLAYISYAAGYGKDMRRSIGLLRRDVSSDTPTFSETGSSTGRNRDSELVAIRHWIVR